MTSGITNVSEYKEYFEKNNFKGNNYETAKFIQFLMGRKTKGKNIEELTNIKHSQITSYKKIIKSGKMEDLRNMSINKVLKSIGTKLDKRVISEFEKIPDKFMLGEDSDDDLYDSDDDEQIAWEEEVRRITLKKSNDCTDNVEYFITELVDENMILRRKITKDGETKRQLDSTCAELRKRVEQQQNTIEELRRENASLLAYKKFFEEMKDKVENFP